MSARLTERQRYRLRRVEHSRIPFNYTDTRDVLARLGLLCDDGAPTNAAAVCFVPSRDIMLRMGVLADAECVHIDGQLLRHGDF